MALIHTITVNTDTGSTISATRTSENRRYMACLVITTTEASVRVNAMRRAAAEVSLIAWRETLAERRKLHRGMTVEQAQSWTKDITNKWYGQNDDGSFKKDVYTYWTALDQARHEVGDRHHSDRASKRAHEIMIKRGFADPYDYAKNPSGIVEAAGKVDSLARILANWKALSLALSTSPRGTRTSATPRRPSAVSTTCAPTATASRSGLTSRLASEPNAQRRRWPREHHHLPDRQSSSTLHRRRHARAVPLSTQTCRSLDVPLRREEERQRPKRHGDLRGRLLLSSRCR